MPIPTAARRTLLLARRGKLLGRDSFNRADNASSLGNLDTGQTWLTGSAADAGTLTWKIAGGRATCTSNPTDAHCFVDFGAADGVLSWIVNTTSASLLAGALFRRQDANNYLVVRCGVGSSNNVGILQNLAGSRTSLFTGSGAITSGVDFLLTVVLAGSLVTVLVDGKAAFSGPQSVTNFATATKHGGYGASSTLVLLDDFSFEVAA